MDPRTHMPGARRASRLPHLPAWAANGMLVVGGAVVVAMLAWGHLGLGALIAPPPPTPARQVATAGPYRIALVLDAGQLTAGSHNAATIALRDAQGRPVDGATVRVQPRMVTMLMNMPEVTGNAQEGGRYSIHPAFAMAGEWRLDVAIACDGAAQQQTSFPTNVRWP